MLYMSCLICYVIWYSVVITLSAYYVTDRSQYAEFAEQDFFNQPKVLLNEGPLPERAESCFSISKYHVLASMILFLGSGRWKSIMTDYTKKHEPFHRKWRSIIVHFLEPWFFRVLMKNHDHNSHFKRHNFSRRVGQDCGASQLILDHGTSHSLFNIWDTLSFFSKEGIFQLSDQA